MRIFHLVPGSGGTFYCENCLRDAGLIRALRSAGHDVIMVPLYLPQPATDDFRDLGGREVFFGGINVYLQQISALFRRSPRWLDRLFDHPALLRRVARRAGMTSPQVLGETTISMLRGAEGRQIKELNRLTDYLAAQAGPDVVCLSNALLIGLAEQIKSRLGAPVVVMLQDEDIFLDDLPQPYRRQGWQIIADQAAHVDAFIAVSHYYAGRMQRKLNLPAERLGVVHCGIETDGYAPPDEPADPPAIGFLERTCPAMGADLLVEAFVLLKRESRFSRLTLRIAGGGTGADEPFARSLRSRLRREGLLEDVEFFGPLDRNERQEFLRTLTAFSVPARHEEAFGLYVLEALATGVPVVLVDRGAFPELLEATGGGLECKAENPASLARQLAKLLDDPAMARKLGLQGRQAVGRHFTVEAMAEGVMKVYEDIVST